MPTNTLGPGAPGTLSPRTIQDFTYAGIASRVMTNSPPTDGDWGASPPPDGTIVIGQDNFLWVRVNSVWCYAVLQPITQ